MSDFYLMDHKIGRSFVAVGPYSTYKEAASDNTEYYGDDMFIVELCVPKNDLGAPDCGYPALMESEVDGD